MQMREMQDKFTAFECKLDAVSRNTHLTNHIHNNDEHKTLNKQEKHKQSHTSDAPLAASSIDAAVEETDLFEDALNDNVNTGESRNTEWVTIRKKTKERANITIKKKPKQNKRNVFGVNPECNAFDVVHRMKYLHVSKFKVTTEPEAIIKYVSDELKVDPKLLTCVRLIKRDADVTKLHFVNFKLGVPEPLYLRVFNKDIWPLSIKLTRFISKPKNLHRLDDVNHTEDQNPVEIH